MKSGGVEKVFQAFDSHAEADEANFRYYLNLSPNERLALGLELMRPYYEAYPRLERVYRTAELGECPVSSDWGLGL